VNVTQSNVPARDIGQFGLSPILEDMFVAWHTDCDGAWSRLGRLRIETFEVCRGAEVE
jgi:hypothetical protein